MRIIVKCTRKPSVVKKEKKERQNEREKERRGRAEKKEKQRKTKDFFFFTIHHFDRVTRRDYQREPLIFLNLSATGGRPAGIRYDTGPKMISRTVYNVKM